MLLACLLAWLGIGMSSSSALAEASQPAEHKTSHKDVAFPSNQAAIPSTRDGMVFSSGANIE